MKKGSYLIPATLAGGLALVLGGCGGGTGTASVSDEGGAVAAKTATVNIAVAFPEPNAGKALISSDAQAVGFRYCRVPQGTHWCDIEMEGVEVAVTRDNPTASISLSPGLYQFEAATFASTLMDTPIDFASTAGEIVEGANQVVMSFLGGDWTFKSSTGADETVTLGDGTVISGFKLYPDSYSTNTTPAAAAASARKAAFDTTIPVAGWMGYGAVLKTSSGDLDADWLEVISQFHSGSDNNTTLAGLSLNLTQNCPGWDCEPATGDWVVDMVGVHYDDYEDYYDSLLPSETLTDSNGDPVSTDGLGTAPTDGVTIVGDFVEFQFSGRTVSLVDASAVAAKAVAGDVPRSRAAALAALASSGDETASKSVTTTNMGSLVNTWYEQVVVASGDGTDRGTWNFDDYVYNPTTETWDQVVDGCLVTGGATVYATCGWLDSVWDSATSSYVTDPGEFAWSFAPTDPTNLGEYCYQGWYDDAAGAWVCENDSVVGGYDPWYFKDMNDDGVIDYGSFQFSHYLKNEETLNNVRVHRFTANGVELPATDVVLQ